MKSPDGRPGLTVGVIAVGDEILEGRILDAHSRFVSEEIQRWGGHVRWHFSLGDSPGELAGALTLLQGQVDWILVTGGLGPTADDRTREEVASAFQLDLIENEAAWQEIQRRLRSRGFEPTENNRKQAFFPQGAKMLTNSHGSAPGFSVTGPDQTRVFALPGVPHEFRAMFEKHIVGELEAFEGLSPVQGEILDFVGVPESQLDEWVCARVPEGQLYQICVRGWGQIEVRLPAGVSLHDEAARAYGASLIGTGGLPVEEHLVQQALSAGLSVTTAESCTGGMISSRLVNVPGSSRIFPCSWVCYSNSSKTRELGVDPQLIEKHGAVSQSVVEQMALKALEKSSADLAISVSGVAGPGGGTEIKPVGTVWLALATGREIRSHCYQLHGDRERIRSLTTNLALLSLLAAVRNLEVPGWSANPS
jgi:nicotinamide-nucleotide amidase